MSPKLKSFSPTDGTVVWTGTASTATDVEIAMDRAHGAWRSWNATPLEERVAVVERYGQYLQENRQEAADLISREVGKLPWDAAGELGASIAKVKVSIQAMQERRSTQMIGESAEPGPADQDEIIVRRIVRHQPLGVALVLGPFNFPLHLPGGQIIPALLMGNTVVFKPSEQAAAVGDWMLKAWRAAGLPNDVLQIIHGGVETAQAAIDSPRIAGVFLTGSREAGRSIHRQLAGRFDVVLALELGGNNPVVVTPSASPDLVGNLASFSAFVSSGQRCTCARRMVVVDGPSADQHLREVVERTRALRVGIPGEDPLPHLGPLISSRAAEGLKITYDGLCEIGCTPVVPFELAGGIGNLVRPCVLDGSALDASARAKLGELEWFGPMLVIQRAKDLQHAIELASDTPYGLAASLLGGAQQDFDEFVRSVGAGVVNWNGPTTGAAGTMPFGGLGDSGNHRPAGYYAIDFCCDPIASIERGDLWQGDPWSMTQ